MLDKNGYYRPTYDEIVATKEQTAKELFGDDIDTSELTPLGKFIRIDAYDLAKAYEDAEMIYYARFPNTATGASLDRLCPFVGISRNPATQARHKIRVIGESGFAFGMGELVVCSADDVVFYSINEYIISDEGYVDVIVECQEAGLVGNVPITDIVEPIAEISGIEYIGIEELGKDEESDIELRKRFALAATGMGSSNVNAIRAAILRVSTVTSASVIENDTLEADEAGRPPHTFECYVSGGVGHEEEIAQAIFEYKPIGTPTYSTAVGEDKVTVMVKDEGGFDHKIVFSRTNHIEIRIKVSYKKDSRFAAEGEAQIATNLADYINGLGLGSNIVLSKLYEYIYAVEGVIEVTDLKISANGGEYLTGNITVGEHQYAYLSTNNVEFTAEGAE